MNPATPTRRSRAAALRPVLVPLLALAAIVALGACGEDDGGGAAVEGADLQVLARDIDFDRDRYELPAGQPTIGYVQEGATRHTLLIEDAEGEDVGDFRLEVNGEETDAGTVRLEPGDYTFYCDIAGHREAGMEAELVVE